MDSVSAVEHATKLGISERGLKLIQEAFESEPERRVKASKHGNNYAFRFPSRKMGVIIQAESSTIEYPVLLKAESESKTLAILDQPPKLPLCYAVANNPKHKQRHTLDYLQINDDEIKYIECKSKKELLSISKKRPDYITYHPESDSFSSPALRRFLEGTGIRYSIIPEQDINPVEAENIELLYDYTHGMNFKHYKKWLNKIRTTISESDGMTIEYLLGENIPPEYIYSAISQGDVYFPIKELTLLDVRSAFVFCNQESYVSFKSELPSNADQVFNFNINHIEDLVRKSKPRKADIARKTIGLIEKIKSRELTIDEAALELKVSTRTIYRRLESYQKNDGHIASVMTNDQAKGNREPRLTDKVQIIIKEIINDHYLTKTAILPAEVFRRVKNRCIEQGEDPPSRTTIYDKINALPPVLKAFQQVSSKKAYQIDILTDEDQDLDLPFTRPTRFLQYCHIDHTQIDVWTKENNVKDSKKAWLTAIRDAYTRKWLGAYMSYSYPNYISVMMCLRSMVARFELLPEYIYVDGGKELNCTSLELFCAGHGIIKVSREGQPRKGGIIERGFGKLNTTFFHNIEGNNKAAKNVRGLDKYSQPKNQAQWSLEELKILLNTTLTSHNKNRPQVGDLTALDLEDLSKKNFGIKPKCYQKMDDNFYYETLPIVPKGYVTIRQSKYVHFNKMDYWSTEFHKASKTPTQYQAKWDPEDYQYIYIFMNGEWISAKTRKKHISKKTRSTSETVFNERTTSQKAKSSTDHIVSNDIEKTKKALLDKRKEKKKSTTITTAEVSAKSVVNKDVNSEDPWRLPIPNSTIRKGE